MLRFNERIESLNRRSKSTWRSLPKLQKKNKKYNLLSLLGECLETLKKIWIFTQSKKKVDIFNYRTENFGYYQNINRASYEDSLVLKKHLSHYHLIV